MIYFDTDVNAPCCPGQITNDEDERTILVQTDWDYPGVASSFGWSTRECQVQNTGYYGLRPCDHSGTDGTVKCNECGLTPETFIGAAGEYLSENRGPVEDPGYFED